MFVLKLFPLNHLSRTSARINKIGVNQRAMITKRSSQIRSLGLFMCTIISLILCLWLWPTDYVSVIAPPNPPSHVLEKEARCLAAAIWHEARGESIRGQIAVANAIVNRSALPHYPSTICGVVKQANQFSGLKKHRYDQPTLELAKNIILDKQEQVIAEATHFHSVHVKPHWAKHMQQMARIGNHIFYKEKV